MVRLMLLVLVVAPVILVSHAGISQKSYSLVVSKNGKDFNERVKIDVRKNSETFHVQEASSGKEAGDIVYDFEKKMTMIRLPEEACFLSKSIGNVPKPADLLQLLRLISSSAAVKLTPQSEQTLKVIGKLNNRSDLTTEMADLCAHLPIYRVTEGSVNQNDTFQMNDAVPESRAAKVPAKRGVRRLVCRYVCRTICSWVCSGWTCKRVCRPICQRVCEWVLG